jgi:hypothetical protein
VTCCLLAVVAYRRRKQLPEWVNSFRFFSLN